MDRDTARKEIRTRLRRYVESVTKRSDKAGNNMYNCPICGSGCGSHSTGAFSINGDEDKWKCFSCDRGGDIFDLIGELYHTTNYNEQLRVAADHFGIIIDDSSTIPRQDFTPIKGRAGDPEPDSDYTDFIIQSAQNIDQTDYHRGITLETLQRFKVGYCANWKHPKAAKAPQMPRLIIPTSKYSYLARDTRVNIPPDQREYAKMKVGKMQIFNQNILSTATQPIYVVEGEIDALSIIDAGGEAIGLGTTTMAGKLLSLLESHPPAQPLILALDNDKPGEKTVGELINGIKYLNGTLKQKGLEMLGIPFYRYNLTGQYKDANEALQANRATFISAVKQGVEECIEYQLAEEQGKKDRYLANSAAAHIYKFIDGLADSVNTSYISTGFRRLDNILDGGLYEGLYIVGAISSLGKTTLITQIADQIAQSGTDVLIFSLEMAITELISKSISRHTIKIVLENGGDTRNAKTARGITTCKRYEHYSTAEKDLIKDAIKSYKEYANHIYIFEGIGEIGVKDIRDAVLRHISFTGNIPVVVIDYLQILAPADMRATDKQNMDKAVMELKRISRDYKIAILGISSFNRENYSNVVTMSAFKESGAIEYSSDVLVGLQLKGIGSKNFNFIEAKKRNPREIELVILKNRNDRVGDIIEYSYYPMFNYFDELGK